jgi:hypothetical protein
MNHYVYIYLNKLKPGKYNYGNLYFEYEPFYVGKGKEDRYLFHLNKVKNKCKYSKNIKFNIIEDHINKGIEPIVLKLVENLTEDISLNLEKEIIIKIGRIDINTGPLVNRNDGGLKPQDNYHHTVESKNKISISGKNRNPEERYKLISPDGQIYDNIKLMNFCIENKLDYRKMRKSSNKGKIKPIRITSIKQSKSETINCVGWTVINKKIIKHQCKNIKFKIVKPDGIEIKILSGDMIKDVCNKYNLDQRTLRYYKNKGIINIKNKTQCNIKTLNCNGWQFIDLAIPHQDL